MCRGIPEEGDILFTTEAPLGNVAEIPKYQIALGQRTVTLCPDTRVITKKFLKWLLLGPYAQKIILEHATGSTALGIKQKTLRTLKFPIPPLDEQEKISSLVSAIDRSERDATASLELHHNVKSALMSDLLTGRKRVPMAELAAAE